MKKLILCAVALVMVAVSCSKEEVDTTNSLELTAQIPTPDKEYDLYKGVFTTLESGPSGVIEIKFPKATNTKTVEYPTANLTLGNGDTYEAKAIKPMNAEESVRGLLFQSKAFSFTFSLSSYASAPAISNVSLNSLAGDIVTAKETENTMVETRTGSWGCTVCNESPYIQEWTGPVWGGIPGQSFNMVIENHTDGTSTITTQVTLSGTVYTGVGYFEEGDCSSQTLNNCERELCNMKSGDGLTTTVGYTANGGPVTWTADRIDNFSCSSVIKGTWQWESPSYGIIEGVFESSITAFCCE